MSSHRRARTLGEILGLDQGDSPEAQVFRCYLRVEDSTNIDEQPLADQVGWYIWRLDQEVENGGIDQFFWNSSATQIFGTLKALNRIGAMQTHRTINEICGLFPDSGPSAVESIRQRQIRELTQDGERRLSGLVAIQWDDNLFSLVLEFARKNLG